MKKLIREFKDFALKGNVLDLAIAVIMGGAAGKMVSSLVESILMPLIGIVLGGLDFASLSITIGSASIQYGEFIQSVVDFLIISLCVFFMMKGVSKMNAHLAKQEEEKTEEPAPVAEDYLKEIRDLLLEQNK